MDGIRMNPSSSISGTETFDLVIPRYGNSEVLLQQVGGSYSLPQVEIPTQRRVAEFLTKRVKEQWGLEAVCLFDPTWENGASLGKHLNHQVLEPRDPNWVPSDNLSWIKRSSIGRKSLQSASQLQTLECSLDSADAFNSGLRSGPFAKAGWMDDLVAWIQPTLRLQGLALNGKFRQLNASPFFSLIRF